MDRHVGIAFMQKVHIAKAFVDARFLIFDHDGRCDEATLRKGLFKTFFCSELGNITNIDFCGM
jgi:hypothetical protein